MIDRAHFFAQVRAHFGALKQAQVDGYNAIIDAFEKIGATDPRKLAYLLATAYHETAHTMQPIREYGRGHGKRYGVPVNGHVYYGRGFVQLTWQANYAKAGAKLGVDLLNNPDLAMEPAIAAQILCVGSFEGWFTGKRLADYFNAHRDDPVGARRIINGTDRAAQIAAHHRAFLEALRA
jgi:putative chitinase